MRLVLVLVLPAAVGLLVMAEPLVALLLQRGEFMPSDTHCYRQCIAFLYPGLDICCFGPTSGFLILCAQGYLDTGVGRRGDGSRLHFHGAYPDLLPPTTIVGTYSCKLSAFDAACRC